MNNKILYIFLLFSVVWVFTAYSEVKHPDITVTMITDYNGFRDMAFNDACLRGLLNSKTDLGIAVRMLESRSVDDYFINLASAVKADPDIIVVIGDAIKKHLYPIAQKNPSIIFLALDMIPDEQLRQLNNVKTVQFKTEESGFLAGIIAGTLTKFYAGISAKLNEQNIVGLILSDKSVHTEPYAAGYISGVKLVNPECTVLTNVIDSWDDKYLGKKYAYEQIDKGADIIFQVAGNSGLGVFQACVEKDKICIGYDYDQVFLAPTAVLTSAIKKIQETVYNLIAQIVSGIDLDNSLILGMKENAVGIALFHDFESVLPKELKDALLKASDAVIQKKISLVKKIDDVDKLFDKTATYTQDADIKTPILSNDKAIKENTEETGDKDKNKENNNVIQIESIKDRILYDKNELFIDVTIINKSNRDEEFTLLITFVGDDNKIVQLLLSKQKIASFSTVTIPVELTKCDNWNIMKNKIQEIFSQKNYTLMIETLL